MLNNQRVKVEEKENPKPTLGSLPILIHFPCNDSTDLIGHLLCALTCGRHRAHLSPTRVHFIFEEVRNLERGVQKKGQVPCSLSVLLRTKAACPGMASDPQRADLISDTVRANTVQRLKSSQPIRGSLLQRLLCLPTPSASAVPHPSRRCRAPPCGQPSYKESGNYAWKALCCL